MAGEAIGKYSFLLRIRGYSRLQPGVKIMIKNIHLGNFLYLIIWFLAIVHARMDQAHGQIQLDKELEVRESYRVDVEGQSVLLEVRKTPVQKGLKREGFSGFITSIYRPQSGLFWWRFNPDGTRSESDLTLSSRNRAWFLYWSAEEIIAFRLIGGTRIAFVRSREKYPTIDAAYKDIAETLDSSDSLKGFLPKLQEISLSEYIPWGYFRRPRDASLRTFGEIKDVVQRDSTWEIEIIGYENSRAVIKLNQDFEVVEVIKDK